MYKHKLKIGEHIQIRMYPEHMTSGKKAYIIENDSDEMEYKVDFGSGWCGYYNRKDLKRG